MCNPDSADQPDATAPPDGPTEPNLSDEEKFKIAEAAAEQIWREQQLTSQRLTWNLTFQGFLLTAFAFAFNQTAHPEWGLYFQIVISFAGGAMALTTFFSVGASQKQRDYIKDVWRHVYGITKKQEGDSKFLFSKNVYPRPYSVNKESKNARTATQIFLGIMVSLWVIFFSMSLSISIHDFKPIGLLRF